MNYIQGWRRREGAVGQAVDAGGERVQVPADDAVADGARGRVAPHDLGRGREHALQVIKF